MWRSVCVSPVKMVLDSVKILACNKVLFTTIMLFTTLPLSTLIISQSISTHNLTSQIHRLEAVAHLSHTRLEARHVRHESRDDAVSLIRIKALFSLPSYLLSLAAALSAVHSTLLASHGKTPTFHSAVAALRLNWMRLFVTTIFVYAILLAFSPVPRAFAALTASAGSRFVVMAIGSGLEVYLMAVVSVGLVVSVAEERFGWEAIKIGSGLMEGRRVCGWFLSGLLVLFSSMIGSKLQGLMDGQDSMGFEDKTIVIGWYGLVMLWSYVIMTVFYCDCRRRHPIREPQPDDDHQLHELSL
ncbi:uncharacterized protein LOC133293016 [Gastrolobium bilobum]|uniref:uncharacterized protein LOC133293016 n=1 Tax=Gastrolobium bilobum TaxID=150636 RepID=UPI002AB302E3|nr:uncharacterized protein LOC133293016 [Gastrolobium bilobum]